MSGKRPSLAESMRQAVRPEPEAPAPVPAAPISPSAPTARPTAGFYAATRAGKKKVTAALDPAMHKQLKSLAVERDTTTEALLIEAIADLFRKHGEPAGGA
jgi:hypothetical protein